MLLFLLGFILIYPGGVAIGLAFHQPPDATPFAIYIFEGMAANLVVGLLLLILRRKFHALAFSAPVAAMLVIEGLRHL